MPGLKSVRVLGTKCSASVVSLDNRPKHTNWKDLPLDAIREHQAKTDDTLKVEIGDISISIKELIDELRRQTTTVKANDTFKLKSAWKSRWYRNVTTQEEAANNKMVFDEIQRLNQQRYKDQKIIQVLKQAISRARFGKLIRNRAMTFRSSLPETAEPKKHIVSRNERYIGKTENMRLYNECDNPTGFTHSGTDNGIATITKTVGFCIKCCEDIFIFLLSSHI